MTQHTPTAAGEPGRSQVEPLVVARGVKKYFPITRGLFRQQVGVVKAVDSVDIDIRPGETFALVGESGSGKTTLGKVLARLYEPTGGTILFDGQDITRLHEGELRRLRRQIQVVFQDPTSSLNPRRRVKEILEDPLVIHGFGDARQRAQRVQELLDLVELPREFLYRYPSHLSGGQKQRVGIARALALEPKFIVLDEPTSALDVSVQAKIVALLKRLQTQLGLTYLFITHDLSLVRNMADHVGVMYLGRLVEQGPARRIFERPEHPYTNALLSCIPTVDEEELALIPEKIPLTGETPSPARVPAGCPFHPRCPKVMDVCRHIPPSFVALDGNLRVSCHLHSEGDPGRGVPAAS
ncbi:MAG: ABC transporter ATP-binding protein [Firmicutes bacterium]|nr:ABC transporter ATP-binding protein [Bacillota bacterium]